MVILGFTTASSLPQLLAAVIFFPLMAYFGNQIIPRRRQALILPELIKPRLKRLGRADIASEPVILKEENRYKGFDVDRRMFLKLIGSAGLAMFVMAIFSNKAQGAFFGSVPGPGTVALKDSTGAQIDPAIKTPTDGYKITEVDDSTTSYYGFLDKDGKWYIMQESSSGAYRYSKGTTNFSTNWTNRASLSYDYFHNIF